MQDLFTTTLSAEELKAKVKVRLASMMAAMEPGDRCRFDCDTYGPFHSAICAVSRKNTEAGRKEWRTYSNNNGRTYIVERALPGRQFPNITRI